MRTLLSLRLTRPLQKILYVLAVWLTPPIIFVLPRSVPLDVFTSVFGPVITVVGIWFGTRVFRGRGEAISPARPWWRWTAWPAASWWLGILFAFLAFALISNRLRFPPAEDSVISWIGLGWSVLWLGAIALAYFNSSIRLRSAGIQKPPRERRPLAKWPTLD